MTYKFYQFYEAFKASKIIVFQNKIKKITLAFFCLLISFSYSMGELKINEIMSNNISAVIDDTYNYSMWVEVFNTHSSQTKNLKDYYFTDDLNEPKKWRPSYESVAPKEFTVLWFERDDKEFHSNFKLNPEGGVLYLMDLNGNLIDQVKYPEQYRNVSYGRLQDGTSDWVYFTEHSHAASNNGKTWATRICTKPEFTIQGGFYSSSISVSFGSTSEGETIYFTIDGSEPNEKSKEYKDGEEITLEKTSIIRAISIGDNKISSEIVSATYFIDERQFNLPVASFITEQKNLTDNTIGIYVKGTNGIPGRCRNDKVNWNQDWDRPTNFELFDIEGNTCLNQELDISIAGGCSRIYNLKSLKISPRKKFGDNRLRYDIFWASKPFRKYKGIQIRNAGNDFRHAMMRDGFMHTLVANRMDIDYQAYQPAICFINGTYYGIQNLRERSNKKLIYSNYGLREEEFNLLDHTNIHREPFASTLNYVRKNNVTEAGIYDQVEDMIDINNLVDYYIAQMYFNNTDWPHNNLKVWRKIDGGKWRWIMYDTDFGFNLLDEQTHNDNTTDHVQNAGDPSSLIFKQLMSNVKFKTKFLSRASIHLSSTFSTVRVNQIMDSLTNAIREEMPYHKKRWGSGNNFDYELNKMKSFAQHRPDIIFRYFGEKYTDTHISHTIDISSNINRAQFKFNGELIPDNEIQLKYFKDHTVQIEPDEIVGYKFKYWKIYSLNDESIIQLNDNWHYWDKYGIPAEDWFTSNHSVSSWSFGKAPFEYGSNFPNVTTTVSYGNNANNKHPTCYFRKNFTVKNLDGLDDFKISTYVDDGVVVYVNGTEVGRYNMPEGPVNFFTHSIVYNNGDWVNFNVPKELINKGENIISAEIHQVNKTSSDMVFDLSLTASKSQSEFISYDEPVYALFLMMM